MALIEKASHTRHLFSQHVDKRSRAKMTAYLAGRLERPQQRLSGAVPGWDQA